MAENKYQAQLVRKLRRLLPGSIIMKGDPNFLQGIPDLLILWRDTWAALECKDHGSAREQPNQQYYVDLMDSMSFAAFIHPGNEDEVLGALQHAFRTRGPSRVSERQQLSLAKLRRRQTTGKVA